MSLIQNLLAFGRLIVVCVNLSAVQKNKNFETYPSERDRWFWRSYFFWGLEMIKRIRMGFTHFGVFHTHVIHIVYVKILNALSSYLEN